MDPVILVAVGLLLAVKTMLRVREAMNLLDVLLEPVQRPQSKPCKLGVIIESLDEPYKTALNGLLESDVSDQLVAGRCREAGLDASYSIVYRHRRKQCRCESVVIG